MSRVEAVGGVGVVLLVDGLPPEPAAAAASTNPGLLGRAKTVPHVRQAFELFFSSEAQENPSSNDAQPEKARPEHNTSQPPEDSRPYANANGNTTEKGAFQTTRNPTGQRRSQHPPNPRTNQLGAAQPPPGKPTESGRKDMHCTHEGQKAEKTRKTGKERKRQTLFDST